MDQSPAERAANNLGNTISDAIMNAVDLGMSLEEALFVTASVAADYGRTRVGTSFLDRIAEVVKERAKLPMPSEANSP